MGEEKTANPPAVAAERLTELLTRLGDKGLNQSSVARRAGIPTAFLSDLKHGHRPLTELVARRLGEAFDIDYEWLMGVATRPERPVFGSMAGGGEHTWVPLMDAPVSGDPRAHRSWSGAYVELAGIAAAKATQAAHPYVLRFGHNDHAGRLKKGDYILISQSVTDNAVELSVVAEGRKLFLARRQGNKWIRAATGEQLSGNRAIAGYCVGVVWSSLL